MIESREVGSEGSYDRFPSNILVAFDTTSDETTKGGVDYCSLGGEYFAPNTYPEYLPRGT
jgi:hypothetical protein